jgi:hypothetical protein
MRSFLISLSAAAVVLIAPPLASAQAPGAPRPMRDVSVTLGTGPVSHGDRSLGRAGSIGGSLTVPIVGHLGARFEGYGNFGPDPRQQPCGLVGVTCTGIGRNGVQNMIVAAGSALYYFGSQSVHPFVIGGFDVFNFNFLSSVTYASQAVITEIARHHTTMGFTAGGGVWVPVGERLVITPEIRLYDGSMLAGANLGQLRVSVAVGYRW